MLKGLVIGLLVLVAGVIGVGFLLPDTAHIERAVVIEAKPATVFTVLNGFQQFRKWSPWEGLDPDARYVTEGPAMGVGAKQSWRSEDPAVGAGSQEILESVPFEKIVLRLVFEGFDSENLSTYRLRPQGDGTELVWAYDSTFHGDLMARYFGLMLDRMIGPDYERGLAQLKTLIEGLPASDIAGLDVQVLSLESQPMLYVSASSSAEAASETLDAAYGRLAAHLAASGLQPAAAPIAITREYDEETGFWRFDAAMIVDRADPPAAADSGIQAGRSYGGLAIRATHTGAYAATKPTY